MAHEPDVPIPPLSADAARRRRGRSWAILIALVGLCALFYAISIVKMAHLG
jgi:hypothetical protein